MNLTQQKYKLILRMGVISILAFLIAPIIWRIVGGIVGAAAAFAVCAFLMAMMPAFTSWLSQLKFGAVKFVIDKAPVLELHRQSELLWQALNEDAQVLQKQIAGVELAKTECLKAAKDFPEEAEEMERRVAEREQLLAFRIEQFKVTKQDTMAFGRAARKAEVFYNLDVQDQQLNLSRPKEDYMERFKRQTAFDAINKKAAESRASMRMALEGITAVPSDATNIKSVSYDSNNRILTGDILNVQAAQLSVSKEKMQ